MLKHIIGKSVLQYTTSSSRLDLLGTDTTMFGIVPNTDLSNNLRVQKTIYVGDTGTYGSGTTKLTGTSWLLTDGSKTSTTTGGRIVLVDPTAGNGYFQTQQNSNIYSRLANNGSLTLHNNSVNTAINFEDGTASNNASITKTKGASAININATTTNVSGNLAVVGDVTANKVWNAVYNGFGEIFRKDKEETIEFGDLVCVKSDGLVHKVNSEEDIKTIVGICSNTVGIGLGGKDIPEDEAIEVEMVGQVWVKTNEILEAGKMVKALANGTVGITDDINNRMGVTLTSTVDGKVRIVYNG